MTSIQSDSDRDSLGQPLLIFLMSNELVEGCHGPTHPCKMGLKNASIVILVTWEGVFFDKVMYQKNTRLTYSRWDYSKLIAPCLRLQATHHRSSSFSAIVGLLIVLDFQMVCLNCLKSCLIAKRFHQYVRQPDYDQTYSPIIIPTTIKTILLTITARNWKLHNLYVCNMFLNGHLTQQVYLFDRESQ